LCAAALMRHRRAVYFLHEAIASQHVSLIYAAVMANNDGYARLYYRRLQDSYMRGCPHLATTRRQFRRTSHAARYLRTCSQTALPILWPACPPSAACSTCMWKSTPRTCTLSCPSNTDGSFYPIANQRPRTASDASQRSHLEDTGRVACVLVACFRISKSDLSLTTAIRSVCSTRSRN
jgi:hypothetical protein